MSETEALNCDRIVGKRQACYEKHGEKSKRCWSLTLKAKRCLSFQNCPMQASQYYGSVNDKDGMGGKLLCASHDESFCFGNPQIMNVDSANTRPHQEASFEHHQKAQRKLRASRPKQALCRQITDSLNECLKKSKVDLGVTEFYLGRK